MLLVGFCERMAAAAVGCEIEFTRARRIGGGFECGAARIGNRTGRQTVDEIGVVGRGLLDLTLHDWPTQRTLSSDQSVDDSGVRLQPHPLFQPVDEYGGDARALFRLAG